MFVSAPGWYPDPTGNKGAARYWDGHTWVSDSAPSVGATKSGRPWGWFIFAMVVITGLVAVFVLRPEGLGIAGGDPNSAKPTGSQWNELPLTETPTETQDPGEGGVIDCPQNSFDDRSKVSSDGRMHGGGLSFQPPGGRDWKKYPIWMPWLYDHNSMTKSITSHWQSSISVGKVLRSEGFTDPQGTATQLMGCLASSGLYLGFSGREDVINDSFTLDGEEGWRITADVFVENQDDILGDVVDVIVLDLGESGELGVFISTATIDNQQNLNEVSEASRSLRVD